MTAYYLQQIASTVKTLNTTEFSLNYTAPIQRWITHRVKT